MPGRRETDRRRPVTIDRVRLVGSGPALALSAMVTVAALRSPEHQWLAWISFLPLFVAVQSRQPRVAVPAGGSWSADLYLSSIAGPVGAIAPAIAPSARLLALLIVIPAAFVGLAARLARAVASAHPVFQCRIYGNRGDYP